MASKRDDYIDLLGVLPDEEIAEQADVTVGTVQRWRRDLEIDAPEADPEPVSDDEDGVEDPGQPESDAGSDPIVALNGEKVARAAKAAAEPAPGTVRSTGKATLPKCPVLGGRTLRLRFRDVHRGDMAAWLWANHRDLVEPFPPAE